MELQSLKSAAMEQSHVKGNTHDFYKYPARFSPVFVNQAIKIFTDPGDLIIDPFVGGGTTAVEARVLGRRCVGIDINSLAAFVSKVKTTPIGRAAQKELRIWFEAVIEQIDSGQSVGSVDDSWQSYFRNIDTNEILPLKRAIHILLENVLALPSKQESFARCSILKTAQWALDSKKEIPSVIQFKRKFEQVFNAMLDSIASFSNDVNHADKKWMADKLPRSFFLNRSTEGIEKDSLVTRFGPPKLILTSPPYPGVHVLYHRWQVKGRKETPAPYWIANKLDGSGLSYYTFGGRHDSGLEKYFENTLKTFSSLAKISSKETRIVQVIAFSDPTWQLPMYLDVLSDCGLQEVEFPELATREGRLWRNVPNRKWFAQQKGKIPSSQEVVLIHKLK